MMKKKLLIIGGIVFVVFLLFLLLNAVAGPKTEESQLVSEPLKQLQDYETIEGEHADEPPDIRFEQLPDGSRIEYGWLNGKLTPEMEEELKKLIEEEKRKSRLRSDAVPVILSPIDIGRRIPTVSRIPTGFFVASLLRMTKEMPMVHAAGPLDTLVFERVSAPQSVADHLKSLFAARLFYWTDRDLAALEKVRIIDSKQTIGGALGAWNFIKRTNPDGSFADLSAMIWLWKDGPIEQTLLHEYGHHYTNYWAAHRSSGAWDVTNRWPITSAGDYYQLRPLRDGCHCAGFDSTVCPYGNRIWEILAEDYRSTATAFNGGHYFSGVSCLAGGGSVGQPNLPQTSAYMAALPLSGGAIIATPALPFPTPTGPAPQCLAVQHCTRGNTIFSEMCGNCQGAGCAPGYTCTDLTYTCTTYQQKVYGSDTLYPIPCTYLSPTPRPPGAYDDVGIFASYFPRMPFVACYDRGGVCTFQDTCLKFSGTTFERNTQVCPTSEGCCIFPNPIPIVRGQIGCERDGGVCTGNPAACTLQGGTPIAGKGCSDHCCLFPSNPTSYANREYWDIMQRVKEGRMSSLAITAWMENACRTPRLQNIPCNPKEDGSCELPPQCEPR